ncbi:MAG: carboxypeptidase-like regulatory domain-containing protein, partial [Segetibacter sp.]
MKKILYLIGMFITCLFFLCIAPTIASCQSKASVTVSGKVIDEKSQPLIGVSVKLENSDIGVATNSEGRFTISVPNDKRVLVLSYLGYENKEVRITNVSEYNVNMIPAVSTLNDVVVVGYSTQRRRDVSGSVVS